MKMKRTLCLLAMSLCLVSVATGQTTPSTFQSASMEQWMRDGLRDHAAEPYNTHSYHSSTGFLYPNLDRDWSEIGTDAGALQIGFARGVYTQAVGYQHLGDQKYYDAAVGSANFMLNNFKDNTYGGMYWGGVQENGTVTGTTKEAIGHGTTMLAMANVYAITGNTTYYQAAQDAWNTLDTRFRASGGPAGAFYQGYDRTFSSKFGNINVNHQMHIFEPLMAVYDVAPAADKAYWAQQIDEAGSLIVNNMVQSHATNSNWSYIPDWYNDDMSVPSNANGGYVNLGHNIEFAYFISRAVERGFGDQSWLDAANEVVDFVLANGLVINGDGTAQLNNLADYDGNVTNTLKADWQQAEALRAAMHFAIVRGRDDLWDEFDLLKEAMETMYFDSETYDNGWFELPYGDSGRKDDKGSVWKAGYHEAMFYDEGIRLQNVPEPMSLTLLGLGGLALLRKRRIA